MLEQLSAVLSIVVIDLVLSGDNAVVIGVAASTLPPLQRRWAMIIGAGIAMVARIVLTGVAAFVLTIPGIKAAGGLVLLWIAFSLLKQEEEAEEEGFSSGKLMVAVRTIVIADVVMSLDNVLGVAAAAHGNLGLLIFGLVVSVGLVMAGGSLIAGMVNRFHWLAYAGAGVIAWTAAGLLLSDDFVEGRLHITDLASTSIAAVVTAVTLALGHYIYWRLPAKRRAAREKERCVIA